MSKRFLVLVSLALAFSGGDAAFAQYDDCPLSSTTSNTCFFTDAQNDRFLNTPLGSLAGRPAAGRLTVCNVGSAAIPGSLDDEFGVRWFFFNVPGPAPSRTGHEDWDDLGPVEWEELESPDGTGDESMIGEADTNTCDDANDNETCDDGESTGQITVVARMIEIADEVVDCDGAITDGAATGSCATVGGLTPLDDTSLNGQVLCTNSLARPSIVVLRDTSDNCSDAFTGEDHELLGNADASASIPVRRIWSFLDGSGPPPDTAGKWDIGEDLYVDALPVGSYSETAGSVLIWTDFTVVGAANVEYKTNDDQGTTVANQHPIEDPVLASDWPVKTAWSTYGFNGNVDILLPGQAATVSASILEVAPTDDTRHWIKNVEHRLNGKKVEQKNSARATSTFFDLCPEGVGFTLTDEGVQGNFIDFDFPEATNAPGTSTISLGVLCVLIGLSLLWLLRGRQG